MPSNKTSPRLLPTSHESSQGPLMQGPHLHSWSLPGTPLSSSSMPDPCGVATYTDGHQVTPLTLPSKSLAAPPRPVPKLGHLLKLLADPRLRSYQMDLEPRRLRGLSRFPSRLGVKIRGHPVQVLPNPVIPPPTTIMMSRALLRLQLNRRTPPRQLLG